MLKMASQAPSSSSNPLAKWLKPVSPTQRLSATQNNLAMAEASKEVQPVKQKNPVGRPPVDPGDSSVYVARMVAPVCGSL